MSTPPKVPTRQYNLDNLAFPRVILASLDLPMLSSEVRTWGELRDYIRANSWNLPAGTYEDVQEFQIQYAAAGPAVPLVPPATSTPTTQARGRGNRGSGRARGRAGRRGNIGARGGGSPRFTTPGEPTPVTQQSEGLSQVGIPSRRVPPAPPVYGHDWSDSREPESSRARHVSAPSQQPSRASSISRVTPPRGGTVVLTFVPGSGPEAETTVVRSYANTPVVGPSAMIRMAPGAQTVPVISIDNRETMPNTTIRGTRDPNITTTIIDSEIPANVSEALCVFPSLIPKQALG